MEHHPKTDVAKYINEQYGTGDISALMRAAIQNRNGKQKDRHGQICSEYIALAYPAICEYYNLLPHCITPAHFQGYIDKTQKSLRTYFSSLRPSGIVLLAKTRMLEYVWLCFLGGLRPLYEWIAALYYVPFAKTFTVQIASGITLASLLCRGHCFGAALAKTKNTK